MKERDRYQRFLVYLMLMACLTTGLAFHGASYGYFHPISGPCVIVFWSVIAVIAVFLNKYLGNTED